jgi:CheY-like chemotaxis protein
MLVDDDHEFRSMFAETLRADGIQILEAPNGEVALAALEGFAHARGAHPDLVVLDLMMPKMSGLELLQRLRKLGQWKGLQVLVVTAVNDPMLPIRLDVPVAYKTDPEELRRTVAQKLNQLSAASAVP